MRFIVKRTSRTYLEGKPSDDPRLIMTNDHWVIDLNTLEELDWFRQHETVVRRPGDADQEHAIVISQRDDESLPTIEIYDAYRE